MEEGSSSNDKTLAVDAPLHAVGFEIGELSPSKVTGSLRVTEKCCQVPILFFYFRILKFLSSTCLTVT